MKTIAIHLRLETASHRKRMMGIFRHVGANNDWDMRIIPNEDALCEQIETTTPAERPDGIISGVPYSERARNTIVRSGIPFVGIGMDESELAARGNRCRFVLNDNEGIGKAAADYFLSLGNFRSFAFIPDIRGRKWSVLRGNAFASRLNDKGIPCPIYRTTANDASDLSAFLMQLPKPAAVFAAWDGRGADVIHAAHTTRLQIPDDLSVLGVDDDDLICEHTIPTLSSIRTDAEGMGEAAAKLMKELLSGKTSKSPSAVRCPLIGITERGSTRPPMPATDLILRAHAFIEAEAKNDITADDVAQHLNISRRLLDLRFKQYESQSVSKCISGHKLEYAKQLLSDSRNSVKKAFAQAGFGNVAYAVRLFRETFGKTPESWRQEQFPVEASVTGTRRKHTDTLEQLTSITARDAAQLQRLVGQLDPAAQFDAKALQGSLRRGETLLYVLRRRSQIAACVTAVLFTTPTGSHCRIEDVVVDERHRDKGLGRKLMDQTLAILRQRHVSGIELTSRPSRVAANALYRSIGFTLHKTNVYKYTTR